MNVDVLYDVRENLGKVMILVGVVLVVLGLLSLSTMGSAFSAVNLFFGLLFVSLGFLVHIGVFSGGFRSLNGFGTILICLSVVFFVFAAVVFQFQDIGIVGYVQEVFKGARLPFYRMLISTNRPYSWLSYLCVIIGGVLLFAGLTFKVYSFLRS